MLTHRFLPAPAAADDEDVVELLHVDVESICVIVSNIIDWADLFSIWSTV